jgi:hypothetical protein
MIENQKIRPAQVIGPLGEPLTLDSLPAPSTTRWVVRRKAEVVSAVNGGLLSVDEACERYGRRRGRAVREVELADRAEQRRIILDPVGDDVDHLAFRAARVPLTPIIAEDSTTRRCASNRSRPDDGVGDAGLVLDGDEGDALGEPGAGGRG